MVNSGPPISPADAGDVPPPIKLKFKKLCLKNKLIDFLSTCKDFKKSVRKSLSLNEYLFPVLHKNRNPEWDCEA